MPLQESTPCPLDENEERGLRPPEPDHGYYLEVTERLGAKRAYLSVARKLARRVHHILRRLGDAAFEEVT